MSYEWRSTSIVACKVSIRDALSTASMHEIRADIFLDEYLEAYRTSFRMTLRLSAIWEGTELKVFASVGTTSWTAPEGVSDIDVLVVAGGGSGGGSTGGGGGAGGLISSIRDLP